MLLLGLGLLILALGVIYQVFVLTEADPQYVMYFPSRSTALLAREMFPGAGTLEERIARMEEGPLDPDHLPLLPEGARVLGYTLEGGVLTLDFSLEFKTQHGGGTLGELVTLYGIANSFVDGTRIQGVLFRLEGEPLLTLSGHVSLESPLGVDLSLMGTQENQ